MSTTASFKAIQNSIYFWIANIQKDIYMIQLRKTKIIATLGPAVDDLEKLKDLLRAGINIARFNFSHGNHEDHAQRIAMVREASRQTGIPVALLLDTKGPEIRTGTIADNGKITLETGNSITLTTENLPGTTERLSISYQALPREVKPGIHILIADGLIDLEVQASTDTEITCIVRAGGSIGSKKNVNVPGIRTSLPAITEQDIADIQFGIDQNMDFIAASFIRKHTDVLEIQAILAKANSNIKVIAKIEDQEGLDNIDEIIRVSHGVMVARGDLGVQLPTEAIPLAQKRIISKCNKAFRAVITATQMLDSMITNPQPTRAEATDVANAIFDGTDAVMLSGETANGKYPVKAVETMHNIALTIEQSEEYKQRCREFFAASSSNNETGIAAARSAHMLATEIGASAMISPTLRGNTSRLISKFRPEYTLVAATTDEQIVRQLLLNWGIQPILTSFVESDSELMIQNAIREAMHLGYVQKLDKVVTIAGIPLNSPIMINNIKVHFLGNILNRGSRGFGGRCSGKIVKAHNASEVAHLISLGPCDIVLAPTLTEDWLPLLPQIGGCILENRSQISPDAILGANPKVVVVADIPKAMSQFEPGQFVSLDGDEKIIYEGLLDQ
jgi:pyruvate kinase